MKSVFTLLFALALVSQPCYSRSVTEEEQSVVSVYTTQSTTAGTSGPLDVYHQIANNIAERITSPIYKFLGIGSNKTEDATTKRPWEKIELLDDMPEEELNLVDNDISNDRDVEELSVESVKRSDKKPEKITLFSSYLPVKEKIELNDTINEIGGDEDDQFNFDDFEDEERKPKSNIFVYVLEWIGSIAQIAWGALSSIFKTS